MKFFVDGWDPSYGSALDNDQADVLVDSTARVQPEVETAAESWAPVGPSPVNEPEAVLFIDGVRRIDARAWIETSPAIEEDTGELIEAGAQASMGLCASFAAGVVCCCTAGAHVITAALRRGLFTTVADAADITTPMGTYIASHTVEDPESSIAFTLTEALQRRLTELEVATAANARDGLAAHGLSGESDLLVIDGPLRGRQHLSRAVGFIKSHRTSYLPPKLHAMVSRLKAGERTPVFLMGTTWDRHSWYLRLPCPPGAPWTGVVRVECSADMEPEAVIALANVTQAVLPRYASVEYKDARAPQNLVPVAALESHLRHQLGQAALLSRALRTAAHTG